MGRSTVVGAMAISITGALALVLGGCSAKGSGDDAKANGSALAAPPPAPAPPPPRPTAVYAMNMTAEDGPNLVLTRVTVEDKVTKLDITMTNRGRTEFSMAVSEAGSDHAMFLQLADGKKIKFQSATGIEVNPVRTKLKPNASVSFTLVFDALDTGVRTFDVFEGEDAKDAVLKKKKNLWVWRNVQLR